ncbi:hypothetical protein EJB05_14537, partial [Eragrostis curvula]
MATAPEKVRENLLHCVFPVLDGLLGLNLNQMLQDQAMVAVMIQQSSSVKILLHVREQRKFLGVGDPRDSPWKKLKGIASANNTE